VVEVVLEKIVYVLDANILKEPVIIDGNVLPFQELKVVVFIIIIHVVLWEI
jgi:hypothetical protein